MGRNVAKPQCRIGRGPLYFTTGKREAFQQPAAIHVKITAIGDGRLNYAPEQAFETYYALSLSKALTVSFNYQHIENPAYNKDRGPADFFGTRIHADF